MVKNIIIKDNWSDINLSDSYLLDEVIERYNSAEVKDYSELYLLLTNIEYEDLINLSTDQMIEIAKIIGFIFIQPKIVPFERITIKGKIYEVKYKLEDLITSQYVDINRYLKESNDNMHTILATVIVPLGKTYNDGYDVNQLANDLLTEIDVQLAKSIFIKLKETLQIIMENFRGLFDIMDKEDEEEETEEEKQIALIPTFNSKWGWVRLAEEVKNLLSIKLDEVWDIEIVKFLNYCTYLKEKNEYEAERINEYKKQ